MSKVFLTYDEQIKKLKNDKKLTINDTGYAKQILSKISYYSLIGGYKKLFKHSPSNNYIYGVTLEELVSFYYFDEELRTLFLKYILHIERNMKSKISYHFCEKYGDNQSEYLDIGNYAVTKRNRNEIIRLVNSFQKVIALPSNYNYITHHARKYGNVPLWVSMNAFTFGQVSKMFQYIPNDVQCKISSDFRVVTERQLHQFITVVARCRNVCAHGERLFDFHIRETIPDMPLHDKLKIKQKRGQYCSGKQDLFSVVIALRYLIDETEFKKFKGDLSKLIKKVLKDCSHITEERLLKEMGFPDNWKNITRYKT